MTELKIQHLLTLSYLLSKGAKYNYVTITTSALGKKIHKSQQAASKHLLELEQNKFISRIISGRNLSVKITNKGYSEIVKMVSSVLDGNAGKIIQELNIEINIIQNFKKN